MTLNVNVPAGVLKSSIIIKYLHSLINLFFPHCCIVCGTPLIQGEEFLCTRCNINLPRTNYHLLPENPIEKMFWGKVDLVHASSYVFYHRGSELRKIVRRMKYTGQKEVGQAMGRFMASELFTSGFFEGIDILIPVPLHPKKLKKRGYNQSEWLAKGIAVITGLPILSSAVARVKNVETQTHKTPFERWENVENIFVLQHPEEIKGKHLLLIDDVLTTGATVLSCMYALSEAEDIKISLLTMAVAAQ